MQGDLGLKGSVDDFIRFNRMLLAGGALDGVRVVSEESVREMCLSTLPGDAELVAPFAFQAAPPPSASEAPREGAAGRMGVVAQHVLGERATGSFGIERGPDEHQWRYRPFNSFPGQGFGLGVAVVQDANRAGLHPRANGTCWWNGVASTFCLQP